ncbi:tRNA(Met) cytidine acetate ligase [Hominifimenecus sp. rT4P-3]|uniref:tRNA(Met) cytidine acetate ligase n=1 Tax=Hominifimenecus sp. rT4P-3 TaxID=3242979 RepID=UPI003DA6B341
MKITAVIAEYNPFHNGHLYHLQQARALTGADAVIVLMSGNFVQRGLPALVDKYRRTEMALQAGADAVFELPTAAATASAEGFAEGAVSLLHRLGAVTDLVYGCETADSKQIQQTAEFLLEEPEAYRRELTRCLKEGLSFPAARSRACEAYLPGSASLLGSPNNILAVEYHKAITKTGAPITPHALLRQGSGYHESASSIRRSLETGNRSALAQQVPDFVLGLLPYTITADDFSPLLMERLLMLTPKEMEDYADVTPQLAARIARFWSPNQTFSSLAAQVKSPDYTLTHIQRALLHLLLGTKKGELPLPFIRLLGFCPDTSALKGIKVRSQLPILVKTADAPAGALASECRAADLYRLAVWNRHRFLLPDEYHAGPIRLKVGRPSDRTAATLQICTPSETPEGLPSYLFPSE